MTTVHQITGKLARSHKWKQTQPSQNRNKHISTFAFMSDSWAHVLKPKYIRYHFQANEISRQRRRSMADFEV